MAYRTHTQRARDEQRAMPAAEASHAAATALYDVLEDALADYLLPGSDAPLEARIAAELARDVIDRMGNLMVEYGNDVDYRRELIARLQAVPS
jgi:hypothetical protein